MNTFQQFWLRFSPARTRIFLTLGALLLLGGSIFSLHVFGPHAAVASQVTVLPESVPPLVSSARLIGHHGAGRSITNEQLTISLSLIPNNQAQMETVLHNLYDPRSSQYHHWLPKGAFDTLFGPTQGQVAAVTRFLTSSGLQHISGTSENYQALLRQEGMQISMSRTADCYDNAAAESFFHSFKGECIDGEAFQTRAQARSTTFDYIECFYNRTLRHSTLQFVSPFQYEQLMC